MFRLLLTPSLLACAALIPAARSAPAGGQSQAASQLQSQTPDLRLFVQSHAAGSVAANARIEVTLGELNPRLQLAPCARVEPFLPSGSRLWGRSHVGLRCTQGAAWSVRMPVMVRVYGPALVATRPLATNTPLTAEDFVETEVEWTRESQGVVTDATQLENRVLTRSISTGQPVPLAALRAPQVIAAGDPVKVLGQGRGFAVSAEAIALSPAQDGQSVRVRTESGRVITGTARAGRRVEVTI